MSDDSSVSSERSWKGTVALVEFVVIVSLLLVFSDSPLQVFLRQICNLPSGEITVGWFLFLWGVIVCLVGFVFAQGSRDGIRTSSGWSRASGKIHREEITEERGIKNPHRIDGLVLTVVGAILLVAACLMMLT